MSIDWGMGLTNIDHETGIRFGTFSANSVSAEALEWDGEYVDVAYENWKDEVRKTLRRGFDEHWRFKELAEALYGFVGDDKEDLDWLKEAVFLVKGMGEAADIDEMVDEGINRYSQDYMDPGDGGSSIWVLKDDEYFAHTTEDGDMWVEKSPWVTRAYFCSPCAPGAGYLGSCEKLHDENGHLAGDCWAFCLDAEFFDEFNPMPYVAVSLMKMAELDDYEYRLTMQEGA